jgi:hypothetical protein
MMRAIHRLRHVGALFVALVFAFSLPLAAHAVTNTWSAAGSLTTARNYHTATLLPSGQVLVAAGRDTGGNALASAERYAPVTNTWSAAGNLAIARDFHTATLLPSGQVLVAGGFNGAALSSAELYDPAANTWSATASLTTARYYHTATLLPSGQVLVAGGYGSSGPLASAERYDPATNTWSAAGSLAATREHHTATLLPSGQVLVAGGRDTGGNALASAELYDPATNTWSAAGNLTTARYGHTATLLPSGHVLVAGGYNGAALATAELYDAAANTWSATASLTTARYGHTATRLPSGQVLVAGGYGNSGYLASAELYDRDTNTWSAAGNLITARENHTATLLPSGQVLVAGGYNVGALASAELYTPEVIFRDGFGDTYTLSNPSVTNVVVLSTSPNNGITPYNTGTTTVRITGTDFATVTCPTGVKLDDLNGVDALVATQVASCAVDSDSQITATFPAGIRTNGTLGWNVLVTNGAGSNGTSSVRFVPRAGLLISEVYTGSSTATGHEFVEAYNPTATAIDSTASGVGLRLHIRNSTGSDTDKLLTLVTSGTIPSHGFLLIVSSQSVPADPWFAHRDYTYSSALVSNGGAYISLSGTANAMVIDKVGWGTQPANGFEGTAAADIPADNSVERKPAGGNGNATDTDNNASDFNAPSTSITPLGSVDPPQP